MKKKENISHYSDEVKKVGRWDLAMNSQLEILAYYLYLKKVKELQDSGEWIKFDCTFVLDQKYFSTSRTGEHYYNIAIAKLRKEKLKYVIKK